MKDNLETIDWNRFEAYAGSAGQCFPLLISSLASHDSNHRKWARGWLAEWPFESLSQIGRLGAMPTVIDAMVTLLGKPETEDKAELLELIVSLVNGAEEYSQFTRWYEGSKEALLTSIRSAFDKGLPLFLSSLAANDPKLRAATAKALALIPTFDSGPQLLAQIENENDQTALRAILAALGEKRTQDALPMITCYLDANDLETRIYSAWSIARIGDSMREQALLILAHLAVHKFGIGRVQDRDYYSYVDRIGILANEKLETLGEEAWKNAVHEWLAGMQDLKENKILEYVHLLLARTMAGASVEGKVAASTLSLIRCEVLQALVHFSRYWDLETYVDDQLTWAPRKVDAQRERADQLLSFALPVTREELRSFVQHLCESNCA